ncbi:non-ribosomal peptide synthetase, partial [Endozoicomonas sp. SM1973]
QPPLMRLVLIQLSADQYQFIWTHHHALLDGWSLPLLFQDLFALYQTASLACLPTPVAYQHYVGWLQTQDKQTASDYWQAYLAGVTAPTSLMLDTPLLMPASASGQTYNRVLSESFTQQLQALTQSAQVSLSTVLQAAWSLLLSRFTGETDVIFGYTRSGRPASLPNAENIVGLFITSLPLRASVPQHPSALLHEWLQALHKEQPSHDQYGYLPLVDIQRVSEIAADKPLFESLLVFENYPIDDSLMEAAQVNDGFAVEAVEMVDLDSYPLSLTITPASQLHLQFGYQPSYLNDTQIREIAGYLETILCGMAAGASQPIQHLQLLSASEQTTLIANTVSPIPEAYSFCIHELFEQQVATTPDQVALVFEDQS